VSATAEEKYQRGEIFQQMISLSGDLQRKHGRCGVSLTLSAGSSEELSDLNYIKTCLNLSVMGGTMNNY